jgi:phosphatidylethanolamine/phosphatidyl-N-methylethanolamine N-methyltransferase
MAAQVDLSLDGAVVELGGGTGVITQALLDAGVEPDRFLVIERDEALHGLLTRRFPDLAITLGDACDTQAIVRARGHDKVAAVVSSLPLLSIPDRIQWEILDQALGALMPGGSLVQFTYGPNCPIPRSLQARHGCFARPAGFALLNLPPATVWRVDRPAVGEVSRSPLRRHLADSAVASAPAGAGS